MKFQHIYNVFPEGEDLQSAIKRILHFLDMQLKRSSLRSVMIIVHRSAFYALEYRYKKRSLEEILSTPWSWRPGWTYYANEQGENRRNSFASDDEL